MKLDFRQNKFATSQRKILSSDEFIKFVRNPNISNELYVDVMESIGFWNWVENPDKLIDILSFNDPSIIKSKLGLSNKNFSIKNKRLKEFRVYEEGHLSSKYGPYNEGEIRNVIREICVDDSRYPADEHFYNIISQDTFNINNIVNELKKYNLLEGKWSYSTHYDYEIFLTPNKGTSILRFEIEYE